MYIPGAAAYKYCCPLNYFFNHFIFVLHHLFPQIKADGTLMQMIGADWLRSNKREDNLAGRPCSLVQV